MEEVSKEPNLILCSTKIESIIIRGEGELFPRPTDLSTKTVLNVIETILVIIRIGTDFKQKYVRSIYATKRGLKRAPQDRFLPFQ